MLPSTDNFFTYRSIQRDLSSVHQQVLFVTSSVLALNNSKENLTQILDKADLVHDFTLLPISTGMERLVIFCVTHLLEEAHFFDEVDRVP